MSAAEDRRILLRAKEEGSSIRKYPFAEEDAGMPFPSTKSELVTITKDGSRSLFVSMEQTACVVENATGEVGKIAPEFPLNWKQHGTWTLLF